MAIDPWLKAAYESSARAKIARADEHLKTLYAETDGWGDGDPFSVARESQADGLRHTFRAHFKVQPDVWRWAVLLGDALDHIVYSLAIHETGEDPPADDAKLAFPICSDATYFAKAKWRIRSLTDTTQTAIEKSQPYNRLKPGQWFMPIWWLAQLNDIDKHRLAHLAPVAAHPDDIVVDAEPGTFEALWERGPLKDYAPFFVLTLTKPDKNVYVDFQATASVVINAPPYPPVGLHPTMQRIRREVVLVCRYLSGCFR